MAENGINELKQKFEKIKNMGYVKAVVKGNCSIGRTFETLLGIKNNDLEYPDFMGIEIKTKRVLSGYPITLFSATPEGPSRNEIERLKNKYGYPHRNDKRYRVLNTSVSAVEKNKVGLFYHFQLRVEREQKKIFLEIYDYKQRLIEDDIYWTFETLEIKLFRKLKILALVVAFPELIHGVEYFKYYDLRIFYLKDFDTFIKLIEQGKIKIKFKIGVFLNGERQGETYDRGTAFEISENDIPKLFDEINNY